MRALFLQLFGQSQVAAPRLTKPSASPKAPAILTLVACDGLDELVLSAPGFPFTVQTVPSVELSQQIVAQLQTVPFKVYCANCTRLLPTQQVLQALLLLQSTVLETAQPLILLDATTSVLTIQSRHSHL